jgi:sterol carrier protein 2
VVSQKFLDSHPSLKRDEAILLAGQALRTDNSSLYSGSAMDLVGFGMTKEAVKAALSEARVSIKDVPVCELHDCFSCNELVLLEALGFCEKGKAHELVRAKDITYGGRVVINPSGGLISKGHPLGATGLAQCAELTWQLYVDLDPDLLTEYANIVVGADGRTTVLLTLKLRCSITLALVAVS